MEKHIREVHITQVHIREVHIREVHIREVRESRQEVNSSAVDSIQLHLVSLKGGHIGNITNCNCVSLYSIFTCVLLALYVPNIRILPYFQYDVTPPSISHWLRNTLIDDEVSTSVPGWSHNLIPNMHCTKLLRFIIEPHLLLIVLNRYSPSIIVSFFKLTWIVFDLLYRTVNRILRERYSLLMSSSSPWLIHIMRKIMKNDQLTANLRKLTFNVLVALIGCSERR